MAAKTRYGLSGRKHTMIKHDESEARKSSRNLRAKDFDNKLCYGVKSLVGRRAREGEKHLWRGETRC